MHQGGIQLNYHELGDLVRWISADTGSGCTYGMVVELIHHDAPPGLAYVPAAMVLWEHGDICYAPLDGLEILSEHS